MALYLKNRYLKNKEEMNDGDYPATNQVLCSGC